MEGLFLAVVAGLLAGAVAKKLADSAKNVPVFKNEKISNSKDILAEAKKAKEIGSDSASILLAFGAIESKLRRISGHKESNYSVSKIINDLSTSGKVNEDVVLLVRQLNRIRNETVHGMESKRFSESKVKSYLDKTQKVLNELSKLS